MKVFLFYVHRAHMRHWSRLRSFMQCEDTRGIMGIQKQMSHRGKLEYRLQANSFWLFLLLLTINSSISLALSMVMKINVTNCEDGDDSMLAIRKMLQ